MVRLPHFYHQSVCGGVPELINFKNPSPVAEFSKLLKDPNGTYQLRNYVRHMGTYSDRVLSRTILIPISIPKIEKNREMTKSTPYFSNIPLTMVCI